MFIPYDKNVHTFDKKHFPSLAFDDMMQEDEVQNIINMKRAVKYAMKKHPYKVYCTEKSGWFTTVDDPTHPDGKKKIRKSSEEKLWFALADWYEKDTKNITLEEFYPKWLNHKRPTVVEKTIKRIEAEWKSYYLIETSQKLITTPIPSLTSSMLREWAESLMAKVKGKDKTFIDNKKFSRIFQIVDNCLEYAADEDIAIISENPWPKVSKKLRKEFVRSKGTPLDKEQVFTDSERLQLRQMIYEDLEKYPNCASSAGLQILLMLETGLRIGECCGLKWSDIKDNWISIERQADNNGVYEWTKTNSSRREIPLTKEAQNILQNVRAFNQQHNYTAEWIFQSTNKNYENRLGYNAADHKLRKLCKRMGTIIKSPHKLRKTCLSVLLDSPNVNNRMVQRFAGHSDISTTLRYYYFDRSSREEQAKALETALRL
ncbi:MAG: site-specific integrase [Lachnospiraceae bacterium]|nr:site-specific integrase [Lachnospiraceae bacterium]